MTWEQIFVALVLEPIHSLLPHEWCGLWRPFGRLLTILHHGHRRRRLNEVGSVEGVEKRKS